MFDVVVASGAPDASRAATTRPLTGLTLRGFAAVIEAAGGRAALVGRSTDWLKWHAVLQLTSDDAGASCVAPCASPTCDASTAWTHKRCPGACGSSFADVLLRGKAHGKVDLAGRANVFVSHAYSFQFLDAVDAIAAWEARERERARGSEPKGDNYFYYYFDLLVVNQHGQAGTVPFDVLRDEFGGGVRGIGRTLFLLDFASASSLTRAWCVFELATTLKVKATLEVIMPPRDEAAFRDALVHDFASVVSKTCTVDVERATAKEPSDLANIFSLIREMGGFLAVNQLVIKGMRSWMVETGTAALASVEPERDANPLRRALARLLLENDDFHRAHELYCVALAEATAAPCARGAARTRDIAECRQGVGVALGRLGKWRDAEAACRAALGELELAARMEEEKQEEGQEERSGARLRVHASQGVLASILRAGARGDEFGRVSRVQLLDAEELHAQALAGCRKLLGEGHTDTLAAAHEYARTLDELGDRAEEVIALYRRAAEGRAAAPALGVDHPDTLASQHALASALARAAGACSLSTSMTAGSVAPTRGALADALRLYETTLAVTRRVFGDPHSRTLALQADYANALRCDGQLSAAVLHLGTAFDGSAAALGAAHPDTLALFREYYLLASLAAMEGALGEWPVAVRVLARVSHHTAACFPTTTAAIRAGLALALAFFLWFFIGTAIGAAGGNVADAVGLAFLAAILGGWAALGWCTLAAVDAARSEKFGVVLPYPYVAALYVACLFIAYYFTFAVLQVGAVLLRERSDARNPLAASERRTVNPLGRSDARDPHAAPLRRNPIGSTPPSFDDNTA